VTALRWAAEAALFAAILPLAMLLAVRWG